MPETLKEKSETEKADKEVEKEDSWEEDQKKSDYYYDDSHGYKTYVPDRPGQDDEDLETIDVVKRTD